MSELQETLSELVALSQYIQNQTDDRPRRGTVSILMMGKLVAL